MFVRNRKKPLVVVILDGWGVAPSWGGNAISQAKTKYFDLLFRYYPSTTLKASEEAVGLPSGIAGNSEAGHMTIGAGRVVNQDSKVIDLEIENGNFKKNHVLLEAASHVKKYGSNFHVLGLLSESLNHSNIQHLYALLDFCKENGCKNIFIHLFSDGRDSAPMSGIELAEELENRVKQIGVGKISSLCGRFFAMDRDNRWGRISRAYNMLVKAEGNAFPNLRSAFSSSYAQGVSDEFVEPRMIAADPGSFVRINDNDAVLFFNYRSDRLRELTDAFLLDTLPQMPDRKKLKNLFAATFAIYDDSRNKKHVFSPEKVATPVTKILSDSGLQQFHCAETEKYAHITYFLNGGVLDPFPGESRALVPSPTKFKTYDLCPKMSAAEVTQKCITALKKGNLDSLFVNFANTDMVGHTGNLGAAIIAAEFVDSCLGELLCQVVNLNGTAIITSDHGNAEQMVNPKTGDADTEHSTNPVPFILFSNELKKVRLNEGKTLSNIAPTMLELLKIKDHTLTSESLIYQSNE